MEKTNKKISVKELNANYNYFVNESNDLRTFVLKAFPLLPECVL